jgi:hypothetical protein
MRFMGPEEGEVVAVSRTPGPVLVGIFAAGASPSDVASLSKGGGEGAKGDGYILAEKPLLIWVSMAFYIFPCTLKLLLPWLL